jgi:hypothetical protein
LEDLFEALSEQALLRRNHKTPWSHGSLGWCYDVCLSMYAPLHSKVGLISRVKIVRNALISYKFFAVERIILL